MIVGELRGGEMSLNLSNLLCSLSTFTSEHKCMFMAPCHSSLLTETWSESLTTLDYKFEFTSEWKRTISGLWSDQYKKGHWDNKKLCRQYTCFLPVTNTRLMPVAQLIWHDAKTCLCLPSTCHFWHCQQWCNCMSCWDISKWTSWNTQYQKIIRIS